MYNNVRNQGITLRNENIKFVQKWKLVIELSIRKSEIRFKVKRNELKQRYNKRLLAMQNNAMRCKFDAKNNI